MFFSFFYINNGSHFYTFPFYQSAYFFSILSIKGPVVRKRKTSDVYHRKHILSHKGLFL